MAEENLPELSTQQLHDEVSKGLRMLKVFENGAQVLKGLVILEQNIREKTLSNAKLEADEKQWLAMKKKAADDCEASAKTGAEHVERGKAEAKRLTDEAIGNAKGIMQRANADAKALMDDAKAEEKAHKENTAAMKAQLSELQKALADGKEELAKVSAAVTAHKEAIKKFLG